METRFGFTKMSLAEFRDWITAQNIVRTITFVQEHHTWSPNYSLFNGDNHFQLQRGMKNHHINTNGWADIGQHFTTFPDGSIMTGRPLSKTPACIYNANSRAICIENLGDFDDGRDDMTDDQANAIVGMTAALLRRFSLGAPSDTNIVYHHWFDLNTGDRTNGTGTTKSCPGTNFFGGNTVAQCRGNFLPRVVNALAGGGPMVGPVAVDKYVCVKVDSLTVRTGPATSFAKAPGSGPALIGSILRVYGQDGGWYKVSDSHSLWVKANRTFDVRRTMVNTNDSKCRIGPGTSFSIVGVFNRGDEVFVHASQDGWSKISMEDKWISNTLLD